MLTTLLLIALVLFVLAFRRQIWASLPPRLGARFGFPSTPTLSHEEGKVQMEALKLAFLYRWGKPAEMEEPAAQQGNVTLVGSLTESQLRLAERLVKELPPDTEETEN